MEDLFLEFGLTLFELMCGFLLVTVLFLFATQSDVLLDLVSQFNGVV